MLTSNDWCDALEMLLTLLPDQRMRLDDEGHQALASAGLNEAQANAAATALKWRGKGVVEWDEDGVKTIRLRREGEEVVLPTEPAPSTNDHPRATPAQRRYLETLGYTGGKPIPELTIKEASKAIKALKRDTHKPARRRRVKVR